MDIFRSIPIQFSRNSRVAERRSEPAIQSGKRRHRNRDNSILLHAFAIHEEEQLILPDGLAQAPAEIVALVVAADVFREISCQSITITKVVERHAM